MLDFRVLKKVRMYHKMVAECSRTLLQTLLRSFMRQNSFLNLTQCIDLFHVPTKILRGNAHVRRTGNGKTKPHWHVLAFLNRVLLMSCSILCSLSYKHQPGIFYTVPSILSRVLLEGKVQKNKRY